LSFFFILSPNSLLFLFPSIFSTLEGFLLISSSLFSFFSSISFSKILTSPGKILVSTGEVLDSTTEVLVSTGVGISLSPVI
jgi:hypothetical protein